MGLTILLKKKPNFIQNLFNGVRKLEFNNPKIKNKTARTKNIITISLLSVVHVYAPIIKKKIENVIPKFLFVGIFLFVILIYLLSKTHLNPT